MYYNTQQGGHGNGRINFANTAGEGNISHITTTEQEPEDGMVLVSKKKWGYLE